MVGLVIAGLAAPSLQNKGLKLKDPYDIIILETEWPNCESLQVVATFSFSSGSRSRAVDLTCMGKSVK